MTASAKIGGTWKSGFPLIKVDGVWKLPKAGFVKVGGVWKAWFRPGLSYEEGQILPTYQTSLTYQATYADRSAT